MNLSEIARKVSKFTIDNSPLILTGLGTVGVITTAVLTGKASYRAALVLENEKKWRRRNGIEAPITAKQAINKVWPLYIPPIAFGTFTIAAVIGANRIGNSRAAALAAAYTLSEKAFNEYKDKVVDNIGDHKERGIRDDVAQDQINRNPMSNREVIITGHGDSDCYDPYSGRYFKANFEEIKAAENHVNYLVNNEGYASLNNFYDRLGLDRIDMGEEVGWRQDKLAEISITTTLSDKMTPVLCLQYNVKPVRDYFRFGK